MKAHLSRRYRISASHRLHSEALTPEENRAVYGKCNNPHGHGHNYVIEVTVSGPVDDITGMVCDLEDLDECVAKVVIARFDHMNLNFADYFLHQAPSTENLCKTVYRLISVSFTGAHLERVRIEETTKNSFEYAGEEAP